MATQLALNSASVLITGGSDGIGLGLAKRFLSHGANVLVTARNAEKLESARGELPGLMTLVNDIGVVEEREKLAAHIQSNFPDLNVVINNAGIQRRLSLATDDGPWSVRQKEIDILFSAPVHLNHLLIPMLLKHGRPSLITNVSSGGAFVPQVFAPVYSACKAAIHSYTLTLRHALANTSVNVVEIIPPAVQTNLMAAGVAHGANLDEFCDFVFSSLIKGETEIGFGPTASSKIKQRLDLDEELFRAFSGRFPVTVY